jgi:hypothetical protein
MKRIVLAALALGLFSAGSLDASAATKKYSAAEKKKNHEIAVKLCRQKFGPQLH